MSSVPEALGVLTGSGIEEGLRFAYAVSELVPAGLVVGAAAVIAGLLGAAAMRKARPARPPVASRAQLPWVLGAALLASGLSAPPSDAAVLCRKGASSRFVVRDACRGREQAVDPRALDLGGGSTCVQDIAAAWDDVTQLRQQLEDARSLAALIAAHPWDGAETWLRLQAAQITQTLARLDAGVRALGIPAAGDSIGRIRSAVTEHWSQPVDACSEGLAIVPEIESRLPLPAAD